MPNATRRRRPLFVIGAIVLMSCAPSEPVVQFTAADETVLRSLFDTTAAEIKSGRWDSWAGHYATDAFFMPPNEPTVRGREAILAWGKKFPALDSIAFSNLQVSGEGNLAWGSSDIMLKVTNGPLDRGKQLAVFRRAPGDGWEVIAVSYSSDLPALATPAAAPAKP